jgi:hypothetical protein
MLPPRTISANGIEISVLEQGDGHWSCLVDNVGDMVAPVSALGAKHAAIVGHDWGAPVA